MTPLAAMLRRSSVLVLASLGLPMSVAPLLGCSGRVSVANFGGGLSPLPRARAVPKLSNLANLTAQEAYDELDYRWGDGLVLFVEEVALGEHLNEPVLGIAPFHPHATHFDPVLLTEGQQMQI